MGIFISYILVGILLGTLFSLLFIRNDLQWVSILTSAGSLGCVWFAYTAMSAYFNPSAEQNIWLFCFYLFAFLFAAALTFFLFSRLLKTQSDKIKLRILDIILGRSKTLEDYYDLRKREIENDLAAKNYEEKQRALEKSTRHYEEILQKIDDAKDQYIGFTIKKNSKFPITREFVSNIPQYIERWSQFVSEISGITRDFQEKATDRKGPLYKHEIDAYFIAICASINRILFSNNPQTVRSHVRVLDTVNSVYRKVVSVEGTVSANKRPMTDIPLDKGMIFHAFREKASLIKSYNPECHYGSTDSQWCDYLTIPLYSIETIINGQYKPYISLGIAINSGYNHEEMLVFLHFMKVERFIQNQVNIISESTNIYSAYNSDEGME